MRVLEVGLGWFPEQPGGLDRYFYELLPHLRAAGVEVHGLVVGSQAAEQASDGRVRAFAPAAAPLPARLAAARRAARRLAREAPPDVLAAHFALYALPVLGAVDGTPLAVHFHGPWAAEAAAEGSSRAASWARAHLERRVYRRGVRCIVHSRAFGRILEERYGVPPQRVRVLPAGVETARFDVAQDRPGARERLGWPQDRPVLLTVRRLVRRMGLERLLEAMVAVCRRVPDALLLVAGRGPLEGELRTRVAALELGDHVQLLGFVPDELLPLAYRAADLTVVPSVALEGFGLTVVESLAAGTPVLVTPVGGLPEVVEGLDPGLVLESSAPGSIAAGIAAALEGRLPLPPPEACRAHVRRHFDWPVVAPRVRAVYEEALR